jgi:poly(A) polymerase
VIDDRSARMSGSSQRKEGILSLRNVDPDALKVVRKLLAAGHEAYLVGGCVRDLYLGLRPKDFDVATSATPDAIRKIFRNSRIIGRRFKLAHVYFGPKVIETSTFRAAPIANDDDPLITADNVWGSIEDDARRRDFTINALFFDVETRRIVDFVDGMNDLDGKIIRTIGDPHLRFQEDPVRMIRAIKFAARLGFTIEPPTWEALLDTTSDITKCSGARVLEETYKVLRGGASKRSFELMLESKLLDAMMPAYIGLYSEPRAEHGPTPPDASKPADGSLEFLWRFLGALDEYAGETGQLVGNGVLQAVLFAPLVSSRLMSASRRDLDRRIDELVGPICASLGVARRDRELARQILMATRRMMDPGGRRRRRPSLMQRQYFHDALIFLGIWVKAQGGDGSELERWRELAEAQASARKDRRPSRRPQRRRGRRSHSRRSSARRERDSEDGDSQARGGS